MGLGSGGKWCDAMQCDAMRCDAVSLRKSA